MTEPREAWSPPPDWRGDIEIEVRAPGGSQALRLPDATREDWYGVRAALAEASQRHAYGRAKRDLERRRREEREGRATPPATAEPDAGDQPEPDPEPGDTEASAGQSQDPA